MEELFQNPKTLIFAITGGVLPAIFWLWFWFKQEDNEQPEPFGMILLSFVLGGLLVFMAIGLEKFALNFIRNDTEQVIIWASIEEILKLLGVSVLILGNKRLRQPIDYPMYFIAVALGFAAIENFLYLQNLLDVEGTIVGMLTGNLRFLGSTLLHAISSSMIGIAIGLGFYLKKMRRRYLLIGLFFSILLHSVFNLFIMKGSDENYLSVYGFLWVVTIINILIFEKLKRMGDNKNLQVA